MYKSGIVIIMLMAWACTGNQVKESQQLADSLQHSDEASQFTLFSENTEFFIEYPPLEVGKESEFLVHLTDPSTYKPLETGNVTIRIDGVSVTSGHAHRPGIFEVPFIPKNAGAFHAEFTFQSGEVTESVEGHLQVNDDHEDLHEEDPLADTHSHDAVTEGEIAYLKEQAWKSDFMVSQVLPRSFSSVISTSGEILAMPGEKKNVAANGKGMVLFSNKNLVQGSDVTRGQHLFTISSKTMLENNIGLQYQESKTSYEKSRSEYERHKILFSQGAISERQYLSSKSSFVADSLRFHSLDANASPDGLEVYAPVTGTIHELGVSEGVYIETGEIMVIISSNQTLLIRADLPQQFFHQLKEIETANFQPAYSDQVYSLEEMNGRLLAAGSSVAENNHYLPIMFEVENDGRLLEGAFTKVYLKTVEKSDCITVPVGTLSEEQGEYYVYVQVTGESFSKRAVSPGENDGQYIEIISGLKQGERVVTKGVMLVKAASMVSGVAGHGHNH